MKINFWFNLIALLFKILLLPVNIPLYIAGACWRIFDSHCTDLSDQFECGECHYNEFTCECIKNKTCAPQDGCRPMKEIQKGFLHCPNGRIPMSRNKRLYLLRLHNISECDEISLPKCDSSTCYSVNKSVYIDNQYYVPYHVICSSQCTNNESCDVFQCDDNGLIMRSQFCDKIVDCKDGSDEVTKQPGFKCNKCVLPQNNLYDNVAQCADNSDFCFDNNSACFLCLDKRLVISIKQLCDGEFDCFDKSDECLCEKYFNSDVCKSVFEKSRPHCFDNEDIKPRDISFDKADNSLTSKILYITCDTKFNTSIQAVTCDQRSECKDYSDECQCSNPPSFCHNTCHSYFPMGDRYCDGVEDPAWQFINKPECPKGFDELDCPLRFKCKAKEKISIYVSQICDGNVDCDDNSDEKHCSSSALFSSDTEMISNPVIRAGFWITGFLVVSGNLFVIATSIVVLKHKMTLQGVGFQRIIILNISIADFIMGVYLLTIAAYSEFFSGHYGVADHEWRSSFECSIIGSLVVISSQTSCFLMVVLTAFRLTNIIKAVESLNSSWHHWIISIVTAWAVSFMFGIIPLLNLQSSYFVHAFSFSSTYHNGTLDSSQLTDFACRVAASSNKTIANSGNEFESAVEFVQSGVLGNLYVALFGYYGQTSICMPRFYVAYGESSWEYSIFIITVNFLCFVFIAVGYIWIVKHSSKSSANVGRVQNNRANAQAARMQRRIARIIATDFCCWIPICIMAYVGLVVEFSDIVYQISAVLLLPINSALNPFLFTSLSDELISWFCRRYQNLSKFE